MRGSDGADSCSPASKGRGGGDAFTARSMHAMLTAALVEAVSLSSLLQAMHVSAAAKFMGLIRPGKAMALELEKGGWAGTDGCNEAPAECRGGDPCSDGCLRVRCDRCCCSCCVCACSAAACGTAAVGCCTAWRLFADRSHSSSCLTSASSICRRSLAWRARRSAVLPSPEHQAEAGADAGAVLLRGE